jgi:hypothetical protein
MNYKLLLSALLVNVTAQSQNLVVNGSIIGSNAVWGGGAAECPYSSGTFENTYITTGCGSNYVMEVDQGSQPQQTINGFVSGAQYTITFRCGWRNTGCNASASPTNLLIEFTDATTVLSQTIPVPNTQTTLTAYRYTFTNNSSSSHIFRLTNPGNTNTCGVIIDDIAIVRASSPGGIGTSNLTFWFNSSDIGIADSSSLFGWVPRGSLLFSLIAPCSSPPVYRTGLVSNTYKTANYNPYVSFNGSNQYLFFSGSRMNLMDASTAGAGGSFFGVHEGGGASQTYFSQQGTNNSRVQASTTGVTFAQSTTAGTNNLTSYTSSARVNILSDVGKSNGITIRDKNGLTLSASNASADVDYLSIGARRQVAGTYGQYYNGGVSEIIAFDILLTNAQAQRVRSYLATKYGVTLTDNSTTAAVDERNYMASNGTTNYWTFAGNTAYHNNLTIIGRDDNTNLKQVKSISTDADAANATGSSMLIVDNNAAFTSDVSYLCTGHDGTSTAVRELSDIPATIQVRMKRIWKFQRTGTGIANTVKVSFDMTGFTPLTGSDLRLLVSTSSTFASSSIIAGTYSAPYFTANLPTTGGVYFTIGSVNTTSTPLPIGLLSFTAAAKEKQVEIKWCTVSEKNNDYFTIERSASGVGFTELIRIAGAGTYSGILNYSTIDHNPFSGKSYYRLKQTDFDGLFTYSNIAPVQFNENITAACMVYNCFNKICLHITGLSGEQGGIAIYDNNGKLCYKETVRFTNDDENRLIEPRYKFSRGMYIVRITSIDTVLSSKFFVE